MVDKELALHYFCPPGSSIFWCCNFIRRTSAYEDCVRFQEIINGWLLHVRLFPSAMKNDPGCSIDILCSYQLAGDDDKTMQGGRQKVWVSLSRILATFPQRNLLVLGGDFNRTPPPTSGHTGSGHRAPDKYRLRAPDFQDIIRAHDLCALSAWSSARQFDMYTFQMGDRKPRIDYILTKRIYADYEARKSRPLCEHLSIDLSPWRGGARRRAVQCVLPLFPGWRASVPQRSIGLGYDKQALDHVICKNHPEVQLLREFVECKLLKETVITIEVVNESLLSSCQELFPVRSKDASQRPWQHEQVRAKVSEFGAVQFQSDYWCPLVLEGAHTASEGLQGATATKQASKKMFS